MSVAVIGSAVVVAGAGVYTAQKASSDAKKNREAQAAAARGLNFGKKPKVATYQPVDFDAEQINSILANLGAQPDAAELMRVSNGAIDADALTRARKFIPNYEQNMRIEGKNATDLLNGRLPYDDVLDIVSDRQGLSNTLGTPGGSANATLRDLGISRLEAMKTGQGVMQVMVQMADQINPVSRRMRGTEMFINPTDRIRATIEQNQLIQQSMQSKNNLDAGISPTENVNAQLMLNSRMQPQPAGVDWGAQISDLSQSLLAQYQLNQKENAPNYAAAVPRLTGTNAQNYRYTPSNGFQRTSIPA